MVGLLLTSWALAAPCDQADALAGAEGKVLELDFAGAHTALDAIEAGFACGESAPAEIARYWLLVGALASFEKDPELRDDALAAARAADPTVWLPSLGEGLKASWAQASPQPGEATLALEPLPEGYVVWIDGQLAGGRLVVRPGLHVVQARAGTVGWGRVFRASANETVTLPTTLTPIAPVDEPDEPPPPPPDPPPPERSVAFGLHLGVGVGAAVGKGLEPVDGLSEPGAKVGPALEVGVVVRPGALWVRAAVAADLAVGGRYVWVDEGEAHGWPLAPAVLASGGVTIGEGLDVGAQLGAQLPGRLPLRAVVSYGVLDRIRVEGRAGVNLGTPAPLADDPTVSALRVEPAFGLFGTLVI